MNTPNNVAGLLIYKFNKSVKAKLAVRSLVQLWRHPTQPNRVGVSTLQQAKYENLKVKFLKPCDIPDRRRLLDLAWFTRKQYHILLNYNNITLQRVNT